MKGDILKSLKSLFLIVTILLFSFSYAERTSRTLQHDEVIEFVRGNTIQFPKGSVLDYLDGVLLNVMVNGSYLEESQWETASGDIYPIYCGPVPGSLRPGSVAGSKSAPLVWFHPNGEYYRGCHVLTTIDLASTNYQLKTGVGSDLALYDDGSIEYVSSIYDGRILMHNQWLELEPRSEFYRYKNSKLKFFRPKFNETLSAKTKYGVINFKQVQDKKRPVTWTFHEKDEHVRSAIIGQKLPLKNFELNPGDGVTFAICEGGQESGQFGEYRYCETSDTVPYIDTVNLSKATTIQTKNNNLIKTRFVSFTQEGHLFKLILDEDLKFTNKEGKIIPLEAGDFVYLSKDLEIIDYILRLKRF